MFLVLSPDWIDCGFSLCSSKLFCIGISVHWWKRSDVMLLCLVQYNCTGAPPEWWTVGLMWPHSHSRVLMLCDVCSSSLISQMKIHPLPSVFKIARINLKKHRFLFLYEKIRKWEPLLDYFRKFTDVHLHEWRRCYLTFWRHCVVLHQTWNTTVRCSCDANVFFGNGS